MDEVPTSGLFQQAAILTNLLDLALVLLDAAGIGRVHSFQRKLLVAPRTSQDFQLRHPVFQLHLLRQHGVIRSGRLKLRGGKHGFIHILTRAGNVFPVRICVI